MTYNNGTLVQPTQSIFSTANTMTYDFIPVGDRVIRVCYETGEAWSLDCGKWVRVKESDES